MRTKTATYVRFLVVYGVIGILGLACVAYVLIHQRVSLPFQNVYTIRAELSAADGAIGGVGQPVDVVGVPVGQITGVELRGGLALITMQIQRHDVPHVYANATATLEPITPLDDMEIDLDPGTRSSAPLGPDGIIGVGQTNSPVQLSDLLDSLDSDTRDYLSTLLLSLDQGTAGRAGNLRKLLAALGPTTSQVGAISQALAARRTELAHFVHNLAIVTRAATQDGQLSSVVVAGDRTLHGIATQDSALSASIAQLPSTMATVHNTLGHLVPFARELGPALASLLPGVRHLPRTFGSLQSFNTTAVSTLNTEITPLVRTAQPLLRSAGPAVQDLDASTPAITGDAQTLNYFLNELGYVPGGADQGFLFWMAWQAHNFNSDVSTGDANGALARATVLTTCGNIDALPALGSALHILNLCPK